MNIPTPKNQRGVALVVSLVILVSLTMLGLTSIQRTTTDLSMAGNQRETGLMFQAAEVGLVVAERRVRNSITNVEFKNAAAGFNWVPRTSTTYFSPDYFASATWAQSTSAGTSMMATFGIAAEPSYLVEYLGDRSQNALAKINIEGYGTQQTGKDASVFRSTARGVGVTGNSFRYVQSYFSKEIL